MSERHRDNSGLSEWVCECGYTCMASSAPAHECKTMKVPYREDGQMEGDPTIEELADMNNGGAMTNEKPRKWWESTTVTPLAGDTTAVSWPYGADEGHRCQFCWIWYPDSWGKLKLSDDSMQWQCIDTHSCLRRQGQ